jgi:hypothetical protein
MQKPKKKSTTLKVFVHEKDLEPGCERPCVLYACKVLRVQLHDYYQGLHFDVAYGDRPDDLTALYDLVEPDRVMGLMESIETYIECVLDDPDEWCQCGLK